MPDPRPVRDLRTLSRKITDLDTRLVAARARRAELIVEAHEAGVARKDIATAAGVSRQAVERALPVERPRTKRPG